jgi:hypothetical protein
MSTTAKSSFVWPETAAPQPQPAAEAWHTPTPWHVDNCPAGFIYINAGSARVARIEDQKYMTEANAQADAAFIVAAVNAHAGLVARVAELENMLRRVLDECAEQNITADGIILTPPCLLTHEQGRAALAKEGGK